MDVRFRAMKILGQMDGFSTDLRGVVCGDNRYGQAIGVYRTLIRDDEWILIGDEGISVHQGETHFELAYSEVEDLSPNGGATSADAIVATLTDGRKLEIPVRNSKGRFRDIWEFYRFLMRAVDSARGQ